jgi:hypothetical protein
MDCNNHLLVVSE